MSSPTSETNLAPLLVGEGVSEWVPRIPDGAVSVAAESSSLVLRASQGLQDRFEELLDGQKAGTLTAEENQEYEAICDLDAALSWLNRLLRSPNGG